MHSGSARVVDNLAVSIFNNRARRQVRDGKRFRLHLDAVGFDNFALEDFFLLNFNRSPILFDHAGRDVLNPGSFGKRDVELAVFLAAAVGKYLHADIMLHRKIIGGAIVDAYLPENCFRVGVGFDLGGFHGQLFRGYGAPLVAGERRGRQEGSSTHDQRNEQQTAGDVSHREDLSNFGTAVIRGETDRVRSSNKTERFRARGF